LARQSSLSVLTPREASIFACLVDALVAPEPVLPPVRQTDAAFFFDRWMAAAPKKNSRGMRALLFALEVAPVAMGYRARFRRLAPADRVRFLTAVEKNRNPQVRQLAKLVKGAAFLSYYGDDGIMHRVGYDADANVERGRELRAVEGRP
jgi:hypothetical protein